MALLRRFFSDASGATSIEYAFIAGLISIAIIAGARSIGLAVQSKFNAVGNGLS
ncbi:MAG TPA: Flp family type IVb pilin [Methylovirgula sp.]|jgi:pilus assembly protein Flp/PilA